MLSEEAIVLKPNSYLSYIILQYQNLTITCSLDCLVYLRVKNKQTGKNKQKQTASPRFVSTAENELCLSDDYVGGFSDDEAKLVFIYI